MIELEKVKNEIHLTVGWSPQGPAACKSVHGAKWNAEKRVWTYPLLWVSCLEIRSKVADVLGEEIKLGPAMYEWAMVEKERQDSIPDIQSLNAVTLHNVNPKLQAAMKSRPFQTVGVRFGAMNKQVLLADDPGLGKTLQTIAMFEEAEVTGPILVVAPKTASMITWPAEIHRWCNGDEYEIFGAHIPAKERATLIRDVFNDCALDPDLRVWVIMNPYWLQTKLPLDDWGNYVRDDNGLKIQEAKLAELFRYPWAGVVVDESHQTLAGSTGNKKKWSQQRVGLGALEVRPNGLRVAISGTPFRGKPENLFGTLQWLRPEQYTSYWKWVKRHFEVFEDAWGAKEMGALRDEDAFYREAASVMLRRSKSQVAPDLPPKMYGGAPHPNGGDVIGVWLPLPKGGAQLKAYREMESDAASALDGGNVIANGVLAEMTRLKQFASSTMKTTSKLNEEGDIVHDYHPVLPSNKWDWILDWLDERDLLKGGKGQGKVIIASQFTRLINLFAAELERLGVPSLVLTGQTSDRKRVDAQRIFQAEGGPKIFLLNTKAGGVSLTLDAADDVIIVDETYIPDDQLQVEDRAHRLSRIDHHVTIWYLRSLNTIEETIGKTTTEREAICKALIDGARGLSTAKVVLHHD